MIFTMANLDKIRKTQRGMETPQEMSVRDVKRNTWIKNTTKVLDIGEQVATSSEDRLVIMNVFVTNDRILNVPKSQIRW